MSELPSKLATYSDLFDRLLDSALLLDFEFLTILDLNPSAERLFGKEQEELSGKNFLDLSDHSQNDFILKNIRIAKRRYYPHQFECTWNLLGNQTKLMKISACPLKLSNGTEMIQIIATDITQIRELELKEKTHLEELKILNQKLEDLSTHDEMTKLFNFRHFKNLIEQEHTRSSRYGAAYSIIFCDVDNFKHYNDRNGHPAGDDVLRGVAEVLRQTVRNVDFPARYGGEEFVALCPQTPSEGAFTLAQKIRENIEKRTFLHMEHQPLGKISISIGVATYPFDGSTYQEILKAADQALYHSKASGRNQVTSAQQLKALKKAA